MPSTFNADWAHAEYVNSWTSNRGGGTSEAEYQQLNLGTHVGDDLSRVIANRSLIKDHLGLKSEPIWLEQVHGKRVLTIKSDDDLGELSGVVQADAAYTSLSNVCLVIMVADCLPILLASRDGQEIAAIHAGWQGLALGVISETLACFESTDIDAYLGPCIGPCHYEIDVRVKSKFSDEAVFSASANAERWMFDLKAEARRQLSESGVERMFSDSSCTQCNDEYFSYRRDGITGRFASFIWRSQ